MGNRVGVAALVIVLSGLGCSDPDIPTSDSGAAFDTSIGDVGASDARATPDAARDASAPPDAARDAAIETDASTLDAFVPLDTPPTDTDSDGTPDTLDCAPSDASIHPGAVLAAAACTGSGPLPAALVDIDCDGAADYCSCDSDHDRFCAGDDCDDMDDTVHPSASETCNMVDDDCDGTVDDGFDADADLVTTCAGDCDDTNALVAPGKPELADGIDNDCNGLVDEPFTDDDGDGTTEAAGDCDDANPEVGPRALEIRGNSIDDDCNGVTDEAPILCDTGTLDVNNPLDYVRALDLCNGEVLTATFVGFGGARGPSARALPTGFGTSVRPSAGNHMVHLSTGAATTAAHDPGTQFDNGAAACISSTHPAPMPAPAGGCGLADPATVCDLAELRMTIRVPQNAHGFAFSSQLFTAEYPTFRCSGTNDTFVALLTSASYTGNVTFDSTGRPLSPDLAGFLDICQSDPGGSHFVCGGGTMPPIPAHSCSTSPAMSLSGTGYAYTHAPACGSGNLSAGAAATTPVTTFVPATPGDTITLRFILFEEADDQVDTSILLDNFRWQFFPTAGPQTYQ